MTNIEAGIPTVVAIAILVATTTPSQHVAPSTLERETALTDIAPHRCPVHDVPIPDDRIDEPDEGRKAGPKDEQAGAGVPAGGLGEVPSEGDGCGGEGEEREDGEYVVDGRHF